MKRPHKSAWPDPKDEQAFHPLIEMVMLFGLTAGAIGLAWGLWEGLRWVLR